LCRQYSAAVTTAGVSVAVAALGTGDPELAPAFVMGVLELPADNDYIHPPRRDDGVGLLPTLPGLTRPRATEL
jgi:hypothetical protein